MTQWILTQEALGLPLTHAQIKEFAQRILASKETPNHLVNARYKPFINEIQFLGPKELELLIPSVSMALQSQLLSHGSSYSQFPKFRLLS